MNVLLSIVLFTVGTMASEDCRTYYDEYIYRIRENSYGRCLSCISFSFNVMRIKKLYCDISESLEERNLFEKLIDNYDRRYDQESSRSLKIYSNNSQSATLTSLSHSGYWTCDDLLVMDLSSNHIFNLQSDFFQMFPQLQKLSLTDNLLTEIKKNNFAPLVDLQKLNLSRNSIKDVSADSFLPQVNLFVIDLGYNKINKLPVDLFRKQYHLELVLLNNNQLVNFDIFFKSISISFLPSVDLSSNNIETIKFNGDFLNVNLSRNKLTHFPTNLTSSISSLNLSHNDIKEISPHSFVNASGMKQLDLSYNLLSTLPTNSFRNSILLENIDISYNIICNSYYGVTDNWISFFLNFQNLKNVSLNGNVWKCSDLKDILLSLKSRNVKIKPGHEYENSNILGISCRNSISNESLIGLDIRGNIMQHILNEVGKYTNYSILQRNVSILFSKINQIENLRLNNLTNQLVVIEEKLNNLNLKKDLDKIVQNKETSKDLIDHINNIIDKKLLKLREEFADDKINNIQYQNITPNIQAEKLLQEIRDSPNAKSGDIINSILLFTLLCSFLYFLYRYYKNANNLPIREEINLV